MVVSYTTTKHKPMKLKCDATILHDEDMLASAGVIVLNHNGRILDRGGRVLGKGFDTVDAEIEAMAEGLDMLADEPGAQHVKVYTDCTPAIRNQHLDDRFGDDFEYMTFDYMPRSSNVEADIQADLVLGSIERRSRNTSQTTVRETAEQGTKPTFGFTD